MRVYHFLNAEYGLEAVRKRHLKVSLIMDLNDPFEFLGVDLSNRQIRRVLKEHKQQLSQENGILCFSKSWRNPVLWAHYADRHRGVCLGFEVPRRLLTPVRYVDARWPAPSTADLDLVKRLLFTKFSHWRYEQEYRAFVNLERQVDGVYFMEFSRDLRLTRLIVGEQSAIGRQEATQAVGELGPAVEMFKARAAFRTFEIVRNKDESWA